MINNGENPVQWAQLISELEEARVHLSELLDEMSENGEIDIEHFSVNVAHIYAHLNRAWNSRSFNGEMTDEIWEKNRDFPKDLEPLA